MKIYKNIKKYFSFYDLLILSLIYYLSNSDTYINNYNDLVFYNNIPLIIVILTVYYIINTINNESYIKLLKLKSNSYFNFIKNNFPYLLIIIIKVISILLAIMLITSVTNLISIKILLMLILNIVIYVISNILLSFILLNIVKQTYVYIIVIGENLINLLLSNNLFNSKLSILYCIKLNLYFDCIVHLLIFICIIFLLFKLGISNE
jgi:hypothetical protein